MNDDDDATEIIDGFKLEQSPETDFFLSLWFLVRFRSNEMRELLTPWLLLTLSLTFRLITGRLCTDFAPLPDIAFVLESDAIVSGNLW